MSVGSPFMASHPFGPLNPPHSAGSSPAGSRETTPTPSPRGQARTGRVYQVWSNVDNMPLCLPPSRAASKNTGSHPLATVMTIKTLSHTRSRTPDYEWTLLDPDTTMAGLQDLARKEREEKMDKALSALECFPLKTLREKVSTENLTVQKPVTVALRYLRQILPNLSRISEQNAASPVCQEQTPSYIDLLQSWKFIPAGESETGNTIFALQFGGEKDKNQLEATILKLLRELTKQKLDDLCQLNVKGNNVLEIELKHSSPSSEPVYTALATTIGESAFKKKAIRLPHYVDKAQGEGSPLSSLLSPLGGELSLKKLNNADDFTRSNLLAVVDELLSDKKDVR